MSEQKKLNDHISWQNCINLKVTAQPPVPTAGSYSPDIRVEQDPQNPDHPYIDVFQGDKIIYMVGESVTIKGFDPKSGDVRMFNEAENILFRIPYDQYLRDFGTQWTFQPPRREAVEDYFHRNGQPEPYDGWIKNFLCNDNEARRVQHWEAIALDYELCAFDRWQHFQDVIGFECTWGSFSHANSDFWEKDIDILDLKPDDKHLRRWLKQNQDKLKPYPANILTAEKDGPVPDEGKVHMDIDVISYLEAQMKRNTKNYQSDFEIDKDIITRAVHSQKAEDKTLLWMSRESGTHCHKECEAFIEGSAAHSTWRYYAEQTTEPIIACAVELTGMKDGVILGNVYDLDYHALVSEIKTKAVQPLEVEKTFQDGFVDRVSFERSSYGYYSALVDEHGPIVESRTIPRDKGALSRVLAEQKRSRDKLTDRSDKKRGQSLDHIIRNASSMKQLSNKNISRENDEIIR